MIINIKKLSQRAFTAIALYSLFTYLIAHLAYLYMNTGTGLIFETVSLYVSKVTEFILPMLITTLVFILYLTRGARSAILFAIIASSARAVYTVPYYYIIFIYNYGYDSAESLVLALLASVAVVAFTVLGAFVALWIALLIIRRAKSRADKSFDVKSALTASLSERQAPADFLQGANLSLLIFSLFRLICSIIPEIIDTVTFLIEYKLDYTLPEIITIMCNYLLLFVLVIVSYLAAVYVKNKLIPSEE